MGNHFGERRALQQWSLSYPRVIAGFFYLTSRSDLTMSYSQLEGTLGEIASAIYSASGSTVTLENSRLDNLLGPASCTYEDTGVIVGQNGGLISIVNSSFSGNACSYVFGDRTPVSVTNSVFHRAEAPSPS